MSQRQCDKDSSRDRYGKHVMAEKYTPFPIRHHSGLKLNPLSITSASSPPHSPQFLPHHINQDALLTTTTSVTYTRPIPPFQNSISNLTFAFAIWRVSAAAHLVLAPLLSSHPSKSSRRLSSSRQSGMSPLQS
jgi:hypothetical protein